jgi:methyl-accepting chemotaxis protein
VRKIFSRMRDIKVTTLLSFQNFTAIGAIIFVSIVSIVFNIHSNLEFVRINEEILTNSITPTLYMTELNRSYLHIHSEFQKATNSTNITPIKRTIQEEWKKSNDVLHQITQFENHPARLADLKVIKTELDQYIVLVNNSLERLSQGKIVKTFTKYKIQYFSVSINRLIQQFLFEEKKMLERNFSEMEKESNQAIMILMTFSYIVIGILFALLLVTRFRIKNFIDDILKVTKSLSKCDFRFKFDQKDLSLKNEKGKVMNSLKGVSDSINTVIKKISESTKSISDHVDQSSELMENIIASSEEISKTVDLLKDDIDNNDKMAVTLLKKCVSLKDAMSNDNEKMESRFDGMGQNGYWVSSVKSKSEKAIDVMATSDEILSGILELSNSSKEVSMTYDEIIELVQSVKKKVDDLSRDIQKINYTGIQLKENLKSIKVI